MGSGKKSHSDYIYTDEQVSTRATPTPTPNYTQEDDTLPLLMPPHTDAPHNKARDSDGEDIDAPKDRFNLVYLIFLLQGTGVLLPWNAFISAPDYFNGLYGNNFLIYVGMTYSLPNLLGLLLVVFFAYRIPIMPRTIPSFIVSLVVLAVVPLLGFFGIADGTFGFVLTLIFVVSVALCTAVLQGGVFGFAGIFPPRMIQAVMSGNGIAGVLVCLIRILTKLTVEQPRGEPPVVSDMSRLVSTSLYFFTGVFVIAMCVVSFIVLMRLPYVAYYTRKAGMPQSSPSIDTANDTMGINDFSDAQSAYDVEEVEEEQPVTDSMITDLFVADDVSSKTGAVSALQRVGNIFRKSWYMYLLQWFVFAVTIALFPGITSNIKSDNGEVMCREWLPIILTTVFNVFDLVGRSLPRWFAVKNRPLIAGATVFRAALIPLFAILINPRPDWLMSYDIVPIVSMILLSVSNGYLTTMLFMLNGPMVEDDEKETAGSMMTFFLLLGINTGSNFSLLGGMLLFPGAPNPCPPITP